MLTATWCKHFLTWSSCSSPRNLDGQSAEPLRTPVQYKSPSRRPSQGSLSHTFCTCTSTSSRLESVFQPLTMSPSLLCRLIRRTCSRIPILLKELDALKKVSLLSNMLESTDCSMDPVSLPMLVLTPSNSLRISSCTWPRDLASSNFCESRNSGVWLWSKDEVPPALLAHQPHLLVDPVFRPIGFASFGHSVVWHLNRSSRQEWSCLSFRAVMSKRLIV